MRRSYELVALAGLIGCSGSDPTPIDPTGVYHVESRMLSAPCGADEPAFVVEPDMRVTDIDNNYVVVWSCTPDGQNCTYRSFEYPIEDGWRGLTAYMSIREQPSECYLGYSELDLYLVDTTLTIETMDYRETIDVDSPACIYEEALRRGATMPCITHERIDATKL